MALAFAALSFLSYAFSFFFSAPSLSFSFLASAASLSAASFSFLAFSSSSFSLSVFSLFSLSSFLSSLFLTLPAALSAYLPTPLAMAPIPAMTPAGFAFSFFFFSSKPWRAASTSASVKRFVYAKFCDWLSYLAKASVVKAANRSPPWKLSLIFRLAIFKIIN